MSTPIIQTSQKIGDIVSAFPQTADVFKRYGVDFCCGGDRRLSDIFEETTVSPTDLLTALTVARDSAMMQNNADPDWRDAPYSDLIDHIINTHHAYVRRELPGIVEYAGTIARVHGNRHPELQKVLQLVQTIKADLDEHLPKEEQELFPHILQYQLTRSSDTLDQALINLLEDEHTVVGNTLKTLRSVTNDYALPEDACLSYSYTFEKLKELEADLFLHIHLENNILFPRLESEKTPSQ